MKLLSQISKIIRLFAKNEMIISYKKIDIVGKTQSGYGAATVVAKRYQSYNSNLSLSELSSNPAVKDFFDLLSSNDQSLKKRKSGKILDVGCGNGAYSLLFNSNTTPFKKYTYSGCETSSELVKICENLHPKCNFFQSFAQSIKVGNGQFDLVICSGTLHYILSGWKKALGELSRVAKDHVVITRLPISKYHNSFLVEQKVETKYGTEIHHFRVFSRHEIEQQFRKLGLRIIARDYSSEEYPITGVSEKIILNNYLLGKK